MLGVPDERNSKLYDVKTDHKIVGHNPDLMQLYDQAGTLIATATRADGVWTVSADGITDVTADTRQDAIMALTEQALAALGGTGYSTMVPHGLAEQP